MLIPFRRAVFLHKTLDNLFARCKLYSAVRKLHLGGFMRKTSPSCILVRKAAVGGLLELNSTWLKKYTPPRNNLEGFFVEEINKCIFYI